MLSKQVHLWRSVVALLLVAVMLVTSGSVLTGEAASETGTTQTELAVVRSGGALLHDSSGTVTETLSPGTALTADGRTADGRWAHVSTAEGTGGWVQVDRVLLFGLDYLPVLEGFNEPAETSQPGDETQAMPEPDRPAGQAATVSTSSLRLNVRSGPGLDFPVVARVKPGQVLTAIGRNGAGDWIQIEQPALVDGFGWVSAGYLELSGDAAALAVSDRTSAAPALPVAAVAGGGSSRTASGLDGTLVFQDRSGGTIFVHDMASGETRALTHGADPAISPDGQRVAFWRDEAGQHQLYLVDIDGSHERPILTRGEMVRSPSWSPDGERIVFSRVTGESHCRDAGYGICLPDKFPYNLMFPLLLSDEWGLSSVDPQGANFRDIASLTTSIAPNWSDRGIVYSSAAGVQLTAEGDDVSSQVILDDHRYQDPALQPGGQRVVFQSLEKDHWEIFSANNDGTQVAALTRPATTLITPLPHNVAPIWSPDGRSILFLSNRSGEWAFWVMNADGSDQRQLPMDVPIEYDYQGEQVASWGS